MPVSELENQINSYCADGEYATLVPADRINVRACESDYEHLVSLSMSNLMFSHCNAWCLYDVYDPASVAYFFEIDKDGRCFRRQFVTQSTSRCFHEWLEEADYASSLALQFCAEGKFFIRFCTVHT